MPPEDWGKSSGEKPWLQTLLFKAAPDARILCFEHGLSADDPYFWEHLVESGDDLLDDLLKLRENERVRPQNSHIFSENPNQTRCGNFLVFLCATVSVV